MQRCRMCEEMRLLYKEQQSLAGLDRSKFIQRLKPYDSIPFELVLGNGKFEAFHLNGRTPFFKLSELDEQTGLAVLEMLEPVDMEGRPAADPDTFYTLRCTGSTISLLPCRFTRIQPLPIESIGRPFPINEIKT